MKFTFVDIINLLLRVIIILLGVLIAVGYLPNPDPSLNTMIGGLMILFGSYRLGMFLYRKKQLQNEENHNDIP